MNIEQEREDFEAWYEKQMGEAPRIAEDMYTPFATACWEAYQAGRAARQSQEREDAERYRWLRRNVGAERINGGKGPVSVYLLWRPPASDAVAAETDAAIDHARRIESNESE